MRSRGQFLFAWPHPSYSELELEAQHVDLCDLSAPPARSIESEDLFAFYSAVDDKSRITGMSHVCMWVIRTSDIILR